MDVSEEMAALAANLKRLRGERGQDDAAALCGLSKIQYVKLELGTYDPPTLRTLKKLACGFGVSVAELLTPAGRAG